jgi:hypothetical protein
MMSIKLDTKALENLMRDDDGEIKLELQQTVIEEFGRRHVKSYVNNSAFKETLETVEKEALKEVESLFGKWSGSFNRNKFALHPKIKEMIQLQAKTAVTYELNNVKSHVEDLYKQTSQDIKSQYEKKTRNIKTELAGYLLHLDEETEKLKSQLLTDKVDSIIRDHVKSILSESFGG